MRDAAVQRPAEAEHAPAPRQPACPGPAPQTGSRSSCADQHPGRPVLVDRLVSSLVARGVWHLVSENPPARGCADAANKRRRLGQVGIPLCDELKSLLYTYESEAEGRRFVLLNSRGHQRLDVAKASEAAGGELTPVSRDELAREFCAEHGTVTPVGLIDRSDVRQLVDDTVLVRFFPPYTMMTNAGDLRHAVEFRAEELFAALPRTEVADIVVEEDKRVPREVLGILTGNSPESGMLLWEKINERIRAEGRVRLRGDTGFPRLVVESLPDLAASMELPQREPDVRPALLGAVERLCRAGVTTLGLACNTTQYYAREIEDACARHGARFVSLAEETGAYLRKEGVTSFDLLGIGAVTDLDRWSDFGRSLDGLDVRVPDPVQVERVTRLAFDVKRAVVSPTAINHLRDLIDHATSTETVVLALTELSVLRARLRGPRRTGKRFVDTLDLLADAMAGVYLEERVATGGA